MTEPISPNAVHFVLQGKGGVGKSFCSVILAQYLKSIGANLHCFDTDPNNKTFSSYESLKVESVELMRGNRIGEDLIDPMMSKILDSSGFTYIIDTGTSNFLSTIAYLNDNDVVNLLTDAGYKVFIHVPISGGGDADDTIKGLASIYVNFKGMGVRYVIWENDLRGLIHLSDYPIADSFADGSEVLAGVIPLRVGFDDSGAYRGDTFVTDIKRLTESRFTISDLMQHSHYLDGTPIDLMKKHRIKRLFADWYEKLTTVKWNE